MSIVDEPIPAPSHTCTEGERLVRIERTLNLMDKKLDKFAVILQGDGERVGHGERLRALESFQTTISKIVWIVGGAWLTSIAGGVVYLIKKQ